MKYFLALLALIYLIFPYDLLPDFFVGAGWIDDLLLLVLLWWFYFRYKNKRGRDQGSSDPNSEPLRDKSRHKVTPKTPYQVLGIERNASKEEVKKAYRKLVGTYHPDKVSHLGNEFRDLAEKRFREIQEAYQELTKT